MGYQGILPSYAIEMDTYYNNGPDNNSDHIAFVTDGRANVMPDAGDMTNTSNLENGQWHRIIIDLGYFYRTIELYIQVVWILVFTLIQKTLILGVRY